MNSGPESLDQRGLPHENVDEEDPAAALRMASLDMNERVDGMRPVGEEDVRVRGKEPEGEEDHDEEREPGQPQPEWREDPARGHRSRRYRQQFERGIAAH